MEKTDLKDLLLRYESGECTDYEKALVETWYFEIRSEDAEPLGFDALESAVDRVQGRLPVYKAPNRIRMIWLRSAAASIALGLCIGGYLFVKEKRYETAINTQKLAQIKPGGNKALLTLADGSQVSLEAVNATDLNKIKGLHIRQNTKGKITYAYALTNRMPGSLPVTARNVITTQRGGTYQILLPDGTHVWLNASSELIFPTAFNGPERIVEMKGEAYFEVAHNAKMPFIVKSRTQQVKVLGTHFNINNYPENAIVETTLLEGSIRVSSGNLSALIKPGQQAQDSPQKIVIVDDVDLDKVVAWKNGDFKFDEPLRDIMQKIGRWYNVEIVFAPNVDQDQSFSGKITRSKDLSVVLKIMENTKNVHFKIEGRRVTVMP
jgi:ferric-dicitrate binding protein FerR (iron transport regulator)